MAIIQIEIADENYEKVISAILEVGNYQEKIDDGSGTNVMIDNPETREEFVDRKLKEYLKQVVQMNEMRKFSDIIL
ncbi:MAG: hypothetical protein WCI36_03090 [bacterium]